jgi:hypothetical protein
VHLSLDRKIDLEPIDFTAFLSAALLELQAQAMRAMADQAEAMRAWIVSDSSTRPARPAWAKMPFEAQRPTDTTVLVEEFFEKAKAYHEAHRLVGQQPTAQNFDALVARCIACHQSHCPGPLKRINRLMIGS